MRRATLLTLAAILAVGCTTFNRGRFAVASATLVPVATTTIQEDVEGRVCSERIAQRLERAVEDALEKTPDANALVDASFRFERVCIVVRGTAVRLGD